MRANQSRRISSRCRNNSNQNLCMRMGEWFFEAYRTDLRKMATDLVVTDFHPYDFASKIKSFTFQSVLWYSAILRLWTNLLYCNLSKLCNDIANIYLHACSKLKLIKSYLRSSLLQKWLANMPIVCFEKQTRSFLNYNKLSISFQKPNLEINTSRNISIL